MCLGIPGQIVEIVSARDLLAKVDIGGIRRVVNMACVVDDEHPIESCLGAWMLVHVGFAMSRIDAEEAAQTLDLLAQIGELQAEMDALRDGAAPQ